MATPSLAAQTSLFVGNLDPRVYRELLSDVFSLAGPVTQCHIVFDKATGQSSGFGFVDFEDHETAQAAMEKFRGRSIYDKLLTIDWARASANGAEAGPQHCLFVGNLSPDVTEEQLVTAFSQFGHVVSAKCAKDPATGKTQGFAFVTFREKEGAQSAMDAMNGQILNNRALRVDWAKGKTGKDEEGGEGGKALSYDDILGQTTVNNVTAYVSGINISTSEERIRDVFARFGPIREIRIPESVRAQATDTVYAFVRYLEHGSAARAIYECQDSMEVDGRQVQVHWGRESVRRPPPGPGRGGHQPFHGGFHQAPPFGGRYQQPVYGQRPMYGAPPYGGGGGRPGPMPGFQQVHPSHRYRPY